MGRFDPESAELPEASGFRVIAPVGAGSRGVVFRARDLETQDLVALKVLDAGYLAALADAPRLRGRDFPGGADAALRLDEARRSIGDLIVHLAAVDAPGLVTPQRVVEVTRGGDDGERALAFAMEFVEGDSLARALQRNVRFAPARAAAIAREVATALELALAAGFVHGGLHPGKLILGEDERTRVLGTGLSETLGGEFEEAASERTSPHVYAADEVLAGDRPTEAADVFSLGSVLYHLLTGLPPFKSRSLGGLKVERADGPLVWPRGAMDELPPKLIKLVDRMTSSVPSKRPRLDHALLSELTSAPRSKRMFRPASTRIEPPRDVAPLEEPGRARASEGFLRHAADAAVAFLKKPNAAAIVLGGATAVFLLALALALRSGVAEDPDPDDPPVASTNDGHDEPLKSSPAETLTVAHVPRPTPPDPDMPDRHELIAVEQVFEANPADAEAYRTRIEELAGRAGDIGVRATALLAGLDRHREKRAEKELARILDRAAALEASGRYGPVLALLKGFPHGRYGGTAASTRARVEVEALRRRAAESFARAERRVRDLLVAGDFAAARAEYASVRDMIGLPDLVERAAEGLRRIGRLEEEAAAAKAERKAKAGIKLLEKDIRRTFADLARLCRTFRYTEAEKLLVKELAKIDHALEDLSGAMAERIANEREVLEDYGKLVGWEAAQFRRVAKLISSGEREVDITFRYSPERYRILAISERGLKVTEGEGELEFPWNRMSRIEPYNLIMPPKGEWISLAERLAIAVFAHHRGMTEERDTHLRIAATLARTPNNKAVVRQTREILDRIEVAE